MKLRLASSEGRFAYEGLDRVIHERARLSVLTSLITNPKGRDVQRSKATVLAYRRQSKPPSARAGEEKMVEIARDMNAIVRRPSAASPLRAANAIWNISPRSNK